MQQVVFEPVDETVHSYVFYAWLWSITL